MIASHAQSLKSGGILQSAFAYAASVFGQTTGKTERCLHIGVKRPEVAIVHSRHIRLQVGIFGVGFAMHFEQHLKVEFMSHINQSATLVLLQAGCNQKHSRGSAEASLKELVFVDDEILIEYGQRNATLACLKYVAVVASKVRSVGEYAQCRCSCLLIA